MRIMIADDHDIIRLGVRASLEARGDIDVVAQATTGWEALAMARETKPDIAIVDFRLPELSGPDLIVALKKDLPTLEVLIYTMQDHEEFRLAALQAGASGYVLKADTERELLQAIDALAAHRLYYHGKMLEGQLYQGPTIKARQS